MSSTWTSSLLLMMIPAFQYCLCPKGEVQIEYFFHPPHPHRAHTLTF